MKREGRKKEKEKRRRGREEKEVSKKKLKLWMEKHLGTIIFLLNDLKVRKETYTMWKCVF